MKSVEIRSLLDFRFVSAPSFSPDGRLAAFVLQTASVEDNCYHGDLWLLDTDTKHTRRLTSGGDAKSFVWSKQGTILFPAVRDHAIRERRENGEALSSWYEIAPDGGEAVPAFTIPLDVKQLLPLDEDRFVLRAVFDNSCPDLDALSESERLEILKKRKNPSYEVLEEAPFWSNGGSFTSGLRQRLYLYSRSTGELKPLTEPWFQTTDCAVFGTKLLYKGLEWQYFRGKGRYPGLWLYDADTGLQTCLLPPDTMRTGIFALSDDGAVLLTASDGNTYGDNRYLDFYTLDPASGTMTKLADYEASVGHGSVGSDARLGSGRGHKLHGGKLWFLTTVDDSTHLRTIDRNGVISGFLTPEGSCDSFDVHDAHVLTCGLFGSKLAELYLDGVQVTFFNDEWSNSHSVITPEFHQFRNADGFDIHGWALKPAGYTPGVKYPAILHIHGGPRTVFGSTFHHEMQVWANTGYFVFYCNPRGSDGRGNEFGDINGKYGTIDYQDLMDFADRMLQKYEDADASRFGVTGGSYGGFMTNWIIGHTDRFAAAVSQRSISNWISFEHTSDIGPTFTPNNQATITREDVQKLWWHSPLKYADRCKTPTLFIHSDADYRCWMVEGISMFTALKMHGCEARMCLFKGENHELSRSGKPRNRIRRMEEILGWMDKYLK